MKGLLVALGVIVIAVFFISSVLPKRLEKLGVKQNASQAQDVTPTPPTPLEVISPTLNSKIGNLLAVEMRVAQLPAEVEYSLRDGSGRVLAGGTQNVEKTDWKMTAAYRATSTQKGVLSIGLVGDSKEILVPILFPNSLISTRIYLYSSDCDYLVPVERLINNSKDNGKEQLQALLVGPTTMDAQNGLRTAIPATTKVSKYLVSENIAAINFSREVVEDAATCPQDLMPDQVKRTLLLNSGVGDVSIAIDNRIPSNLQP